MLKEGGPLFRPFSFARSEEERGRPDRDLSGEKENWTSFPVVEVVEGGKKKKTQYRAWKKGTGVLRSFPREARGGTGKCPLLVTGGEKERKTILKLSEAAQERS